MLPSPLTVAIAGTNHSLVRINQDNFGSVYLKKDANSEIRLQVRHSLEKSRPGEPQYERHNVDLSIRTFPTVVGGRETLQQSYVVIRTPRGSTVSQADEVLKGLNALMATHSAAVIGWSS